ncbi:MAG: metal-dependent hydrolase, partial [Candidatus Dormiibacterota bacterium]
MDTITHAFAGALLGKGLFTKRGADSQLEFSSQARVAIFAATAGSIFPDVDFFYEIVSRDNLVILKYHRYV